MQLFICPNLHLQGQLLTIKNHPELVRQLRKVLRAKPGYRFLVQNINASTRYQVLLQDRTDTQVTAILEATLTPPLELRKTAMAIALPNKPEKLELIVQKLTEI